MSAVRDRLGYELLTRSHRVGVRISLNDALFTLAEYSGENRHYHNASHVLSMLDGARALGSNPLLDLAIIFHDVIYDATSKTNELDSANFAVSATGIDDLHQIIMDTTHQSPAESEMGVMIQDLDLMGLGASHEAYSANTIAIRREFEAVDDETFYTGRIGWIEMMLAKGRIFNRSDMLKKYEVNAHDNLSRELDRLRDGDWPLVLS